MDTPTRAIVRRALDELKPYLASYVSQALGSVQDNRWSERSDVQALLGAMLGNWGVVFSRSLPSNVRNFIFELKDVRNRWAHEESFDGDDARRAIDTTRLVAKAIGAPRQVLDTLDRLASEAAGGSAQKMLSTGPPTRPSPSSTWAGEGHSPGTPERLAPIPPVRPAASGAGLNAARVSAARPAKQRDVMRQLWEQFAPNEERVIREYAAAERRGEVGRTSNAYGITPEDYARRLFADGQAKGWLSTDEG